jgi:hypothetical protein
MCFFVRQFCALLRGGSKNEMKKEKQYEQNKKETSTCWKNKRTDRMGEKNKNAKRGRTKKRGMNEEKGYCV